MSEVLARIRVRETHGIRRFLYPLSATIKLMEGIDKSSLGWSATHGDNVPLQITPLSNTEIRLDFALSMAPLEARVLELVEDGFQFPVPDPLKVTPLTDNGLHSNQERVSFDIGPDGNINQVVYDGIPHLQQPTTISNPIFLGSATTENCITRIDAGLLTCWLKREGDYLTESISREGGTIKTRGNHVIIIAEITACKSWVKQTFSFQEPGHSGMVIFQINLAPSSAPLFYDFGVGGGIYGKLKSGEIEGSELHIEFNEDKSARWSLKQGLANQRETREDYRGVSHNILSELWFHISDTDKSLAVALTPIPSLCTQINVILSATGKAVIEYLGHGDLPAKYGVCYHFLNDVPAIAAATNPQSILLPPVVEVLPV